MRQQPSRRPPGRVGTPEANAVLLLVGQVSSGKASRMQGYATSFGLGFVAGMRNMTACAALAWAASEGRTRDNLIPAGPGAPILSTGAAIAEMAGD